MQINTTKCLYSTNTADTEKHFCSMILICPQYIKLNNLSSNYEHCGLTQWALCTDNMLSSSGD